LIITLYNGDIPLKIKINNKFRKYAVLPMNKVGIWLFCSFIVNIFVKTCPKDAEK
jgi:hypothetical protein